MRWLLLLVIIVIYNLLSCYSISISGFSSPSSLRVLSATVERNRRDALKSQPDLSCAKKHGYQGSYNSNNDDRDVSIIAAMLPGDPLVTGTVSLGVLNAISLYSNIIFARVALSWFPQLPRQFPILRPIFTVTDPYLRIFQRVIPPIGGFDISIIPAVFALTILSQTTAAIGSDIPSGL